MARSTRESILTAAAELMRHKGYGAVGVKDIAQASGAPIGSLYHHFRGGKVQIAREALINAGHAYALLMPSIVDEYDDLGDAVDAVFTQAAEDMAGTGFANMCPVASVAAEVADTVEELRETSAAVFQGWVDGGSAYFARRGLNASWAREVALALIAGGCVRTRTHASQHRTSAGSGTGAGSAVPRRRPGTACRGRRRRIRPLSSRTGVHRRG
jgi:AcrR family transcriptional regulator